jgi:hypothetical protein
MGGGGAQRPVWCGNELIKTGARSARARTRGQNTLVNQGFPTFIGLFMEGSGSVLTQTILFYLVFSLGMFLIRSSIRYADPYSNSGVRINLI